MSEQELRDALLSTLRMYHMVAYDVGHDHPIEQCRTPMIVQRLALATEQRRSEWECGSCGAITDKALLVDGEPYHAPDADCRSVTAWKPHQMRSLRMGGPT
jgi:hypothetical protein